MRLKRLTLYHYKRPFEFVFKSAHTKRTCADSVILAMEFTGGIVGYGESAPRAYVTGETIRSVGTFIQASAAPVLFQTSIASLADIEHALDAIERKAPGAPAQRLSALGCVDLALLDALGQHNGCGVAKFLDAPLRDHVPLSLSLPLSTPQDIGHKWHQLQRWLPVAAVKLVMSRDIKSNRDRAAHIRQVIGPRVDLRIEVNGQWTYPEACRNLEALSDLDCSGVEEPLIAADRDKLPQLRADFNIPVILDESICLRVDAERAIASRNCDGINIKVSKCGGLIRSQSIMRLAAQKNIACQIGTHVGESIILDAAGWQLARTAANLTYFEGCSFLLHNPSLSAQGGPPSRQRRDEHPGGWGLAQDDIDQLLGTCDRLGQIDG